MSILGIITMALGSILAAVVALILIYQIITKGLTIVSQTISTLVVMAIVAPVTIAGGRAHNDMMQNGPELSSKQANSNLERMRKSMLTRAAMFDQYPEYTNTAIRFANRRIAATNA